MRIPHLSDFFDTLKEYRHSTTIALILLYITPFFFPVGWNTVGATWQFVAGLMFFLSLAMIVTEDFWPWLKRKFQIGVGEDPEKARFIVEHCDSEGEPPYQILAKDVEEFDELRKFCVMALDPDNEISTTEDAIVITQAGVDRLRNQL